MFLVGLQNSYAMFTRWFMRWFMRYLRAVYLLMTFSVAQNDSAPQPIPKIDQ